MSLLTLSPSPPLSTSLSRLSNPSAPRCPLLYSPFLLFASPFSLFLCCTHYVTISLRTQTNTHSNVLPSPRWMVRYLAMVEQPLVSQLRDRRVCLLQQGEWVRDVIWRVVVARDGEGMGAKARARARDVQLRGARRETEQAAFAASPFRRIHSDRLLSAVLSVSLLRGNTGEVLLSLWPISDWRATVEARAAKSEGVCNRHTFLVQLFPLSIPSSVTSFPVHALEDPEAASLRQPPLLPFDVASLSAALVELQMPSIVHSTALYD